MLATFSTDRVIKAAEELVVALSNQAPAAPFHTFGDSTLEALQQLSNIFSILSTSKQVTTMTE